MSRIKEALVFKTDEERLKWFHALPPAEQEELIIESKELINKIIETLLPVVEEIGKAIGAWLEVMRENAEEITAAFELTHSPDLTSPTAKKRRL